MNAFQNDDFGKLILRLMVGGLMLFHGISKLANGVDGIESMVIAAGFPAVITYGIYVAEVVAPILIILGIQVRLSALTIVIAMVGAIYLAHLEDIWKLTKHGAWGIELQMLFLLSSLSLMFMGSGRYVITVKK